ncbi:unnamed protein product [Schistocephalus solidus]|uniref:Uncharacterized protein n=1 Tax=Schistocephalus solidus TaxID=70667 RepID=A0A183SRF9_SCHSO|nr:unnamed protein product [Schistocephalus solidus]
MCLFGVTVMHNPLEPPFGVSPRNTKTCLILRGDKEGVVSVNRVKAAVAEEPPDLLQGQNCADPCSSTFPIPSSNFPSPFSTLTTLSFHPSYPYQPRPKLFQCYC